MRKKLLAIAFATALLTGVLGGSTAYAHTGHESCKDFGERRAAFAQNNTGLGQFIKNIAPPPVEFAHGFRCDPK